MFSQQPDECESTCTTETSFTIQKVFTSQTISTVQPVPLPRHTSVVVVERDNPKELCNTVVLENTPTANDDPSQRLSLPQSEERMSRGSISIGSRRQSVGGWSVGSINSQSDSRSYRERLRERIQTVKEQAGTSVATANARLKQTLKVKSPHISHFHDLIGREESEVEAALERHGELRKKWKHMVHASLEAETAHNFFTKEWKSEQNTEETPGSPKVGVDDSSASDNEQVKLVTKDYLGLSEDWQVVECYVEPTLDDLSLRLLQESQLYYFPSDQTVALEDKLGPDCVPRYIEEEGLYVSPKPIWSSMSYNKLQHRLIMEGRRHWFGEDGELRTVLGAITDGSSDPLLAPVYKNAEIMMLAEPYIRQEPSLKTTYLLELEVASVSWSHHPLCSPEHVVARRVLSRYQEYSGRVQTSLSRRLANKLQALRTARDNVKRSGELERYTRYRSQVKETRELRLEEGRKDRVTVVNCLKAWLELRTLRTQQGYTLTPIKLNIVELDAAAAGDCVLFGGLSDWDSELKCQVAELLEEEEEEYTQQLEKMANRQKTDEETEVSDLKRILKRSPSDVLKEVQCKLAESLTPPGEPVIALELGNEQTTPEAEIHDQKELERRVAHKRCHLSVRVLCNKQAVCVSRPLALYPHFTSSLNQRFSLQVSDWPQSLSFQLVVEGGIGKQLNALVFVPIPSRSTTLIAAPSDQLEFNSPDKLGPYPHAAVGCGVPDSSGSVQYAGGLVTCRVGWGDEGGPSHKPPYHSCRPPHKILDSAGSMREWISRAQLDPNDPSNAELFEYIKNEDVKNHSSNKDEDKSVLEGDFCKMDEIENNPRLKLLSLRSQVVPEFRDIRNIPIRDREIPEDIFKVYEKRIQSPVRSAPGVGETAMEWQREWSRQQLDLIRDNIVQHCRQTQQQHSLREVVLEDQVPDIGTLGLTFMKWLQPKRPLRPTRKERKKLPVMGLVGQEVEVIVNVVRAFEVQVRMDVDPILDNGLSLVPVRPFVEVSFQNRKSRTTTAEGANPTWNQDLRIPVKLPSCGVYSVQDKLYCQLYDETVVDLLEDDRQRETDIHQRLQRQWLGSLQIPFSSLCSNSRIEGTFQLYSPPVLLGYQRESQHRQLVGTNTTDLRDSTFLTLFITVHPPLHPPEPFKETLPCSELPYLEQHLEEWQNQVAGQFPHRPVKCLVVDTSAKSVCVTRFFRPLAPPVLEEGEHTTPEMAVRFISKIPMVPGSMLFPGLFDVWLTAQQVLTLLSGDCEDHAVLLCCYLLHLGLRAWLLLGSGVPHGPMALVLTRDTSGSSTLWDPTTGQQFNTQDSFCPLHRVYCLINQDNIWANVQREEIVTRTRFDVTRRGDWWPAFNRNVAAPVESVQPAQLDYVVSPTLKTDVALLQDKLEKILRDSITKWRPTTRTILLGPGSTVQAIWAAAELLPPDDIRTVAVASAQLHVGKCVIVTHRCIKKDVQKTIWNRYVTVKLRKLLPGLEKAAWTNNISVSSEHISQLSQTLSSHKMCGFTQNFTFTTTDEIVDVIKATGVHTNENPDVEFALAVYVHPFVCGVLSVWVYVTSLTQRR